MKPLLLGALAFAAFVAGFFFFHYYRLSRDRFFFMFGGAFALLGLQWMLTGALQPDEEIRPFFFLIRLAAFLVIIGAIVDKNRRRD